MRLNLLDISSPIADRKSDSCLLYIRQILAIHFTMFLASLIVLHFIAFILPTVNFNIVGMCAFM